MDSILISIKKLLGIAEEDDSFDMDIIMLINSAFVTLQQIGVGPSEGFAIEDDLATWVDYLGDDKVVSTVRNYIWLKVKMVFDPPTSSFVMEAIKHEIAEDEWRLMMHAETKSAEEASL